MYICDLCHKKFKKWDKCKLHLDNNKECYNNYYKDKIEGIDYVECKICKKKFRCRLLNHIISKHNISLSEYKKMFPNNEINSDYYIKMQKQSTRNTKNDGEYICICGKKYRTKYRLYNHLIDNKECYNNYYKDKIEGIDYVECKICGIRRDVINNAHLKHHNILLKEYLNEFPNVSYFLPKIEENRIKTTFAKYGVKYNGQSEEVKLKIRNTMKNNYDIYTNYFPNFSLISQKLFKEIEKYLLNLDYKYTIYYATNKKDVYNEYQVYVKNISDKCSIRHLDFYIKELNKWIEFDELYHNNKKQIENDIIREQEIFKALPNVKLLRISESEYRNNKQKTIEKCIKFILEEGKNECQNMNWIIN